MTSSCNALSWLVERVLPGCFFVPPRRRHPQGFQRGFRFGVFDDRFPRLAAVVQGVPFLNEIIDPEVFVIRPLRASEQERGKKNCAKPCETTYHARIIIRVREIWQRLPRRTI
jgi:hypothetical protein